LPSPVRTRRMWVSVWF